jgi:hypothetical protein
MRNKPWSFLLVFPVVLCAALMTNCSGGGSTPPPTTEFYAQGENDFAASDGSIQYLSGTTVQGLWEFDEGSAQGNTTPFSVFTNGGFYHVADGRVPARWRIFTVGACVATTNPERDVTANSNQLARCLVVVQFLAANPSSVDLSSPPAVVSIGGGGFDATYGMPLIQYYDQYSGVLIASMSAFSVASDGSSLQANTPDLSSVCAGSYNVVVSNVAADGSTSVAGVASVNASNGSCGVGGYDPPPDPPPCGGQNACIQ